MRRYWLASYLRYGRGKSLRALEAESNGCFPLTTAAKVLAERLGCSRAVARAALEFIGPGEAHHVGKFATLVDYYDTRDERLPGIVRSIIAAGGARKFKEKLARREEARRDRQRTKLREPGWYQMVARWRRRVREKFAEIMGRQPSHYPVDIAAYYGVDRWLSIGDLAAALPVDAFVLLAIDRCCEVDDIKRILDARGCVELSVG